jgi:hypothetical protein
MRQRRSPEEDAGEPLRTAAAERATAPQEHAADVARRLLGPRHGVELDLPRRGAAPGRTPPNFSPPARRQTAILLYANVISELLLLWNPGRSSPG